MFFFFFESSPVAKTKWCTSGLTSTQWWCGSRMLFIHLYFLHEHMVSLKSADWLVHWIYPTVYASFKISRWFQRKTSGCICTSVFTWNCLIALHNCHCLEVSLEVELIVYWWEQSVEHETKSSLFLWILNSDFPKLLAWEILQEFW